MTSPTVPLGPKIQLLPSGNLYVSEYEYVDGEEHDAKIMFSGTHLLDYIVYIDNGDIEKVTEED